MTNGSTANTVTKSKCQQLSEEQQAYMLFRAKQRVRTQIEGWVQYVNNQTLSGYWTHQTLSGLWNSPRQKGRIRSHQSKNSSNKHNTYNKNKTQHKTENTNKSTLPL